MAGIVLRRVVLIKGQFAHPKRIFRRTYVLHAISALLPTIGVLSLRSAPAPRIVLTDDGRIGNRSERGCNASELDCRKTVALTGFPRVCGGGPFLLLGLLVFRPASLR